MNDKNEWVKEENGIAIAGLTKKAVNVIEEVCFIEFPKVGSFLQKNETSIVIESTKAAIDISFPVSGIVLEVNSRLQKEPHLLIQSPEEEGWLLKLQTIS